MRLLQSPPLRSLAAWFFTAIAVLLMLAPYLHAGFFFDDIYNSVVRGQLIANDQSLPEFVGELLRLWVVANGRFFPLAILSSYPLWDFADSLLKARIFQIGLALADIWLFHAVARRLLGRKAALIAILLLPALVQFNPRWDGLSSFSPLNQLVLLFGLLAWLSALRACETGSHKQVLLSAGAAALGLLTYEIGIVGWVGALAIAWLHRRQSPATSKSLAWAHLAMGAVYFLLYATFRAHGGTGYDGVHAGSGAGMVATFAAQYFSAFPFSYLANKVLPVTGGPATWRLLIALFLCFAAAWLLALRQAPESAAEPPPHRMTACALALAMSALPALAISVSARYQQIVLYGDPYTVVYMQYFGTALLLALAGTPLWSRLRGSRWAWAAAALLAGVCAATVAANYKRIEAKNADFRWPREQMEYMVQQGLLDAVPAHSLLLVQSPHLWESESESGRTPGLGLCAAFFSQHARKPLRCSSLDTYVRDVANPTLTRTGDTNTRVFILRRLPAPAREGSAELIGDGIRRVAEVDRRGRVRLTSSPEASAAFITVGAGFYGWEPQGAQEFAWAGGEAELNLLSLAPAPLLRRLELSIQSAIDQRVAVRMGDRTLFDGFVKAAAVHSLTVDDLLVQPGRNTIHVRPSGTAVRMANGDPRPFSFRALQIKVR